MTNEGTGFLRAPERSRTRLLAFRDPLIPHLYEVGVDKLEVTLRGTWSAQRRSGYPQYLSNGEQSPSWMGQPQISDTRVKLETSRRADRSTTLRKVEICVYRRAAEAGTITAKITCNPTRTLAHLLRRYPEVELSHLIRELPPEEFFEVAPEGPARSLDDNDNWLDDPDRTYRALGRDPFGAFLPVFVDQLHCLVLQMVAPEPSYSTHVDGTDLLAVSGTARVSLYGNNVTIKSIETYLERHHRRAPAAVHLAAQRALFSLDEANAFLHYDRRGLRRNRGSLTLLADIPSGRKLSIYAKAPTTIRFEVRRHDRGRYGQPGTYRAPSDRLLHMIEYERQYLLTACDWGQVGRMFTETPWPLLTDLADLIANVTNACVRYSQDPASILSTLLREGALPMRAGDDPAYTRMINHLQRTGILDRVSLRIRDEMTRTRLASLQYEHTLTYEALANALDGTFTGEPT